MNKFHCIAFIASPFPSRYNIFIIIVTGKNQHKKRFRIKKEYHGHSRKDVNEIG